MTLQPGNSFTVVRQIANHLDTDTNYVRAVIRNAYTDAIIATLDLTDKGSQRFKKDWQVPADPSGQGFYISIVTSVYTTSGYTTKNGNYGDEENTYLVQDRVLSRGGGGGLSIYDVRRVIKEELGNQPKPEPIDYTRFKVPIWTDRTGEVLEAIGGINIPEAPKFPEIPKLDLTPSLTKMEELLKAIQEKDVTPETDLSPVLARLEEIESKRAEAHSEALSIIQDTLPKKVEEIMQSVELKVEPMKATKRKPEPEPKEELKPFNIKDLAL